MVGKDENQFGPVRGGVEGVTAKVGRLHPPAASITIALGLPFLVFISTECYSIGQKILYLMYDGFCFEL